MLPLFWGKCNKFSNSIVKHRLISFTATMNLNSTTVPSEMYQQRRFPPGYCTPTRCHKKYTDRTKESWHRYEWWHAEPTLHQFHTRSSHNPYTHHNPSYQQEQQGYFRTHDLPSPRSSDVEAMRLPPAKVTPVRRPDQQSASPPSNPKTNSTMIWQLTDNDIVCGRGAPVNWQKGNQRFRQLISSYQTAYLCSPRSDKPNIATEVLEVIRSRGGRFVRRVKTAYCGRFGWEEIEEKRAYEKICQALREGAPELRRKMLASSSHLANPEGGEVLPLRKKEKSTTRVTHAV